MFNPRFLAGALLLMLAAPLSAQRKAECRECESAAHQEQEVQREIDRIRADLEALRRELASQGQLDESTARAIRNAIDELERSIGDRRRSLREVARGRSRSASSVRAMAPRPRPRMPAGWFGVVISSEVDAARGDGEFRIVGHDYPVIEAVEPGSPADRAGLLSGDVLLMLDREDVRDREIDFASILRPGRELPVRVRRNGRVRDLVVRVGERPPGYGFGFGEGVPAPMPVPRPPDVRVRVELPQPPDGPRPAPVPALAPLVVGVPGTAVLAGAQLTELKGDMREVFGVERGVLVLDVLPGTPAMRAGLRPGDVITACEGTAVQTPYALQRLAQRRTGDVQLALVRKGKPIEAVLKR